MVLRIFNVLYFALDQCYVNKLHNIKKRLSALSKYCNALKRLKTISMATVLCGILTMVSSFFYVGMLVCLTKLK
jgi:hypothetical protein